MTPKSIIISQNHKTNPLCTLILIIGILLISIYLIENTLKLFNLPETTLSTLLGLSIIVIGIGIILYFFSCLFGRLADIAKEIEDDESLCPPDDSIPNNIDK